MKRVVQAVQIKLDRKMLFNPTGDDSVGSRRMIGGDSTNLLNLNDVKYQWATSLYREMLGNFWIPEKIDLTQDKQEYRNELTKDEVSAFEHTLSFLTFLDSIQTNNLPNIFNYITAPEVATLGAVQAFQEAIHSQAYAYVFESVIPADRRREVYYLWRENDLLLERNKYIADIYQDFIDKPDNHSFARALIANYILECLYFYNGFNLFYSLAYRGMMLGTADNINYINRDEGTHVKLFRQIIIAINNENDHFITEELVHEMFEFAVQEEIKWAVSSTGNKTIGITEGTITDYTKFLANKNIVEIGFSPLYDPEIENPYKHLDMMKGDNSGQLKSNFFESTVTSYSMASLLSDWDKI